MLGLIFRSSFFSKDSSGESFEQSIVQKKPEPESKKAESSTCLEGDKSKKVVSEIRHLAPASVPKL